MLQLHHTNAALPGKRLMRRSLWRSIPIRAARLCRALSAFGACAALGSAAAQQSTLPDPKPESAVTGILAAFQKYSVVGMMHGHGYKDVDDFILGLVRHPAFPDVVNDIVVECTNSRHQAILDRYIAGEDVRFEDARQAWEDVQPGCLDAHVSLFPLVRRINQRLAPEKRLRVIAGEPPMDWTTITREEIGRWLLRGIMGIGTTGNSRDSSMALVVAREVLAKQRKALLLYGTGHLLHQMSGGGVNLYERQRPGVTFVIDLLSTCPGARNDWRRELHDRAAAWPVPSIALIRNTSVADVREESLRIGDNIDAFLYLGPSDFALRQPTPSHVLADSAYMAELRRRHAGGASTRAQALIDPVAIREREANPFVCRQ